MKRTEVIGAVALWASACLAACSSNANNPVVPHPEAGVPDAAGERVDAPGDLATASDLGSDHPDGPPAGHCGRTPFAAKATVVVHAPTGDLSCATVPGDGGMASPHVWSGLVTSSDATSIVVDTCAGSGSDAGADGGAIDAGASDAGCAASPLVVEANAPGLDLSHFPRVRVRVTAKVSRFRACLQALEIDAAETSGADAEAPGALLLAVNDGGDVIEGAPYGVAHVPLGCSPAPVCNGAGHNADEYAFDFSDAADVTHRIRVYMTDTVAWTLGSTGYTIHNLRSFQTQVCDDYWNWAYWIYAAP